MNPRLVLHLFATDWRRLRWFLLLAWLGMLLSALPALRFGLADFLPYYGPGAGIHAESYTERGALYELLRPSKSPDPWSGYARMLLPLLLAGISASLGFNGAGWAKVRPLRWRERALAALLGVLAFIVLPQCALIAANFLVHGFSGAEALLGALQAGAVLLAAHACSVVLGRVCGSLWRWFAALAGISVLTGLLSLLPFLPFWWRDSGLFFAGWWGEFPSQLRPTLLTLAAMLVVVALFRGGRRPRLRATFTLLVVALIPILVAWQMGSPQNDPLLLSEIPRHPQAASIHAEYVPGSLIRHYPADKTTTTNMEAAIDTVGLPEDEKMMWVLAEAAPFSHEGKTIPQKWGWFPAWRGKDIADTGFPMSPQQIVSLPFTGDSHDSNWHSMTKRWWLGSFDLTSLGRGSAQLDMDAGLLGIAMRYREILRAPLHDTIDLKPAGLHEGRARVIRSGPLAPAVDISYFLGSLQKGGRPYADTGPMQELHCFLHLGGDRYVEGECLYTGAQPLLSRMSAVRRVIKFRGVGSEVLADAKLVIVRFEITGSVRTRVKAAGLTLAPLPESGGPNPRDPKDFIGPSRSDWRYPVGRPSPDSCTEDQAGQWLMQVINSSERNAGRDLTPFVKRFPKLFLSYQGPYYRNEPIIDALTRGLPETERHLLLEAFAKAKDPGSSPYLPVILARGWQDECRETVLKGLRGQPSEDLISAAASYADPTLYPLLLEAMDKKRSRQSYYAIRRLPGIEPALSRQIEAGFARDLPGFMADPNSSDQATKLGIPAAHGNAEAFALLFPPSRQTFSHGGLPEAMHILMNIISGPPTITTWEAWADFIRTGQASDFHYDSFTGTWLPNNSKRSAK